MWYVWHVGDGRVDELEVRGWGPLTRPETHPAKGVVRAIHRSDRTVKDLVLLAFWLQVRNHTQLDEHPFPFGHAETGDAPWETPCAANR